MDQAVILPGVWAKAVTIRGDGLTNVFVNEAFGQYDYLSLGAATARSLVHRRAALPKR